MSKNKILIVDDEDDFRSTLVDSVKTLKMNVLEAEDGRVASEIIKSETPDVILSDIKMPNMHGIELLKFTQQESPDSKVILMTGYTDIMNIQEAYELGALGFLLKPFRQVELFSQIESVLATDSKEEPFKGHSIDFCHLQVDDFITGNKINFPIFLKLANNKYVKVAHTGEDIEPNYIDKLKAKGVELLYLRKKDFRKYIGFNLELGNAVAQSKEIDLDKKIKFLNRTTEIILEYGLEKEFDPKLFNVVKKNLEQTFLVLSDSKKFFSLIESIANLKGDIYSHSIAVSMIATMMAKKLNWVTYQTQFLVLSAGILHDIGLKDVEPSFLNRECKDPTLKPCDEIKDHPKIGADLISEIPEAPRNLNQIILQHHENCDATGYPAGLRRPMINSIAKIISIADEFCHWLNGGPAPNEKKRLPATVAFKRMKDNSGRRFERDYIQALSDIIKEK